MAAKKSSPRKPRARRKTDRAPSSKPPKRLAERLPGQRNDDDDDSPRLPLALRLTLIVVAVVAVAGAVWIYLIYPARRAVGDGHDVELVLPGDESPDALAERLAAAGVVESPRLFALYIRAQGGVGQIAAGTHLVTNDLAPSELLSRLARRPGRTKAKVTFPEGWTRFDMAKRLQALRVCAQAPFLAATTNRALLDELHIAGESAEGFLFPATYDLLTDSDPADVVRKLKAELDRRYAPLAETYASGVDDLQKTLQWSEADILTMASIVEKETAAPDERALVASVFLNRLRDPNFKRHVLQSDPTAGYGCLVEPQLIPACAGYTGHITHDINMDPANRWSSYTHERLPPGPIANPGARSIEAVLAPANTHYLYFFARNGHTTFTETYDAHNAVIHGK